MNDAILWSLLGGVVVALIGAASLQLQSWLNRRDSRSTVKGVSEASLRQANIDDARNLRADLMKMYEDTRADVKDLTEQLRQERTTRMQETEAHRASLDTERVEREAAMCAHTNEIAANRRKLLTMQSRMADLRTRVQRVGDLVEALNVAGKNLHPAAWVEIVTAAVGAPELPSLALLLGDDGATDLLPD